MNTEDIEKKEEMLSIVAYGCHKKIHREISKKLEEEHKLLTFFFYEYFLTTPLLRNTTKNQVRIFAPFLERVLNRQDFIPKNIKHKELVKNEQIHLDAIEFTPKSDKAKEDFWKEKVIVKNFFKSVDIGPKLCNAWNNYEAVSLLKEPIKIKLQFDEKYNLEHGFSHITTDYLRTKYLIDISDRKKDVDALTKEFILVVYPWLKDAELKNINIFCASISTKNLFFGYILLFYPDLKDETNPNNTLSDKVVHFLLSYIKETYAPLLALFENYFAEDMIEKDIKKGRVNWGKYIYQSSNLEDSNDPVEKALWKLWNGRKIAYDKGYVEKVKESLIFSKYLIGSPGMVDQIKKVMSLNLQKGDSLPAVLVVGGPGSGKDKMAKLIKLFSDEYRFGREYIINMAMLRPNEITVPLLMGIDIKYGNNLKNIQADGIFMRAKEDHSDRGSPNFSVEDFKGTYKIEELYSVIQEDIRFSLKAQEKTIKWLNELLKVPNFYEELHKNKKIRDTRFSKEIDTLVESTKDFRNKIFSKLKNDTKKEIKRLNRLLLEQSYPQQTPKSRDGLEPVFIFDELNSLDIDSQGSLLRVIENAKIIPLGGLEEEKVNFLIIGIMNEDPESITMQRPLEEILKKERIFTGVLGDILYEYFRKMRRLRDDLYYRIIRDGKIIMADLKDRREDIPMMSYFFVKKELDKKNKNFKIDIEVYDVLMDETLPWPGNFRQLQAITKETIREAKNDIANTENNNRLEIRSLHVRKAIEKDHSLKKKGAK